MTQGVIRCFRPTDTLRNRKECVSSTFPQDGYLRKHATTTFSRDGYLRKYGTTAQTFLLIKKFQKKN